MYYKQAERLAGIQTGEIQYEPIDYDNKANHLYIMNDSTAAILAQKITITYKTCEDPDKEYTTHTCALLFVKKEAVALSSECIDTNCVR